MSNSALSQSAFTTALAIQMHLQIDTDLIIPTAIQHMSSSQSMQPNINRFWPGIFQVDVKQLFTRSQNWINWGIGFKLRTQLIEMHKISKDFCNFQTFQCEQLLERFTVVSLSVRLWKRISFWHLNSPTRFKCYNSAQFMSAFVIDYLKIIAIPRRPNLILFNHLNPAFQICTTAGKRKNMLIIQNWLLCSCRFHCYYNSTSRAARGGGGSFKNRKRIGEIGCCESRMTKRKH